MAAPFAALAPVRSFPLAGNGFGGFPVSVRCAALLRALAHVRGIAIEFQGEIPEFEVAMRNREAAHNVRVRIPGIPLARRHQEPHVMRLVEEVFAWEVGEFGCGHDCCGWNFNSRVNWRVRPEILAEIRGEGRAPAPSVPALEAPSRAWAAPAPRVVVESPALSAEEEARRSQRAHEEFEFLAFGVGGEWA